MADRIEEAFEEEFEKNSNPFNGIVSLGYYMDERVRSAARAELAALKARVEDLEKALRDLVDAVEVDAEKRAIAAELGVSEWRAFLPNAEVFDRAREMIGGAP